MLTTERNQEVFNNPFFSSFEGGRGPCFNENEFPLSKDALYYVWLKSAQFVFEVVENRNLQTEGLIDAGQEMLEKTLRTLSSSDLKVIIKAYLSFFLQSFVRAVNS